MRVSVIDDVASFVAHRDEWDSLLSDSGQDSPFLRHERIRLWWQVFGDGRRLRILAARDGDDRLAGIFPAFVSTDGRVVRGDIARFLGDGWETGAIGLTPFARRGYEDEVFTRFADEVQARGHGWDVLDMNLMDAEGHFGRLAATLPRAQVQNGGEWVRVRLPDDWDGYLKTLKSGDRREMRRLQRRAEEHGTELEVVRDAALVDDAVRDLTRLNETRMRQTVGSGYTVSDARKAVLSRLMRMQAEDGDLRLMFMRLGTRRVAALYMFRYRDTMYAEQSGFEEVEGLTSVMTPLWGYAIRSAIEEGCRTLDMMLGGQAYKYNLGVTDARRLLRVRLYSSSPRGRARRGRDALVTWSRKLGKAPANPAPTPTP